VNYSVPFSKYIKENYKNKTPEQVLNYIYAVLHSPAYRKKYAEFLKSDFPRIPFTDDKKIFDQLSELGAQLIALHTAEKNADKWGGYSWDDFQVFNTQQNDKQQIGSYIGSGKHLVEEVRFELLKDNEMPEKTLMKLMPEEKNWGRIYISKNKFFNHVPQSIWQMQIGGYQVLEKWLKYRKGRELSTEETKFYPQIIRILFSTKQLMKQIDSFTKSWI
jgi:hypothetical protein